MNHNISKHEEEWFRHCIQLHNNFYNYEYVDYKGSKEKVIIVCPVHGQFLQTPMLHKRGCGCPKCARNYGPTLSTEQIVSRLKREYKDRYDLSLVEWKGSEQPIIIICKKHGQFSRFYPDYKPEHLCRECQLEAQHDEVSKDFERKANKIHKGKYKYKLETYKSVVHLVTIICLVHGEFEQTAGNHLYKECGCPKCADHRPKKYNKND